MYSQVDNPEGSLLRKFQSLFLRVSRVVSHRLSTFLSILQQAFGWTLPLAHGRGIFQYDIGLLPRRVELHTVMGGAIPVPKVEGEPSPQLVDKYHTIYIAKLKELYRNNVDKYSAVPGGGHRKTDSKPELRIVG